MRITADVDISSELIEAATDGSLVLFIGAGVSMNAPSDLPLFDGLGRQLASLQGVSFDTDVPPDAFIGRLCDEAPIVREQVRRIIANSKSRPNATHWAIVRLANASAAFRVVTTNYDEHLTSAATAAGIEIDDVYHGPAVPLGRNFTGMVYLHGRVSRPATELVLTDDDFGRAYLTDGWARTFVQDLFMARTVLFIGYSHNDSVMKYLARGLPPTTSRYALTEIPNDTKWRDLRITPVPYPDENNHEALTVALEAWADRLAMGQLDHRARIKEIVRGEPPKLPVEADYLADAISTAAGVRAFAEEAGGSEWLLWVESQQVFRNLFVGGQCSSDESRVLASWFVDRYVMDPESTDLALGTIARLGPVICNELMREIARAGYFLGGISPDLARKWSTVVFGVLRTYAADLEELWISPYGAAITGVFTVPFLRRTTRPRLVLTENKPWFSSAAAGESNRVKGEIAWSSSRSNLMQLWDRLTDELPTVAPSVLQIFEQSLRDAYEMLDNFNGDSAWDAFSFSRSAIEPHSQDRVPRYESILIDGLRDASVLVAAEDKSVMSRWLSDRHALFRRLGLHLLIEDRNVSNQAKLDILLDGQHLFDRRVKHEVFRLLAAIAPTLNEQDRERLLVQVAEGPPPFGVDDETEATFHQRSIFDVAEWLSRHVENWQQLESAIAEIRSARPGIGVRTHPDFDHWFESGARGVELPFDVDQFIEHIENNGANHALHQLVERDYSEWNFDEATWEGALSLVRNVIAKRPDLGEILLPDIKLQKVERKEDLISATIGGWSDATLSDELVPEVLQLIENLIDRAEYAHPISELCLSAVSEIDMRKPEVLEDLDALAARLWNTHAATFDEGRTDNWILLGLNTWPGFLAQYWINRIRLRWRAERDEWQGLSAREEAMISTMINTRMPAGDAALAMFAKEAYFLFAADESYTVANLFPTFDVDLDNRAPHVWASYLHNPRANDAFLDAGFWRLLQAVSACISDFPGDRIDWQYWQMLASISINSNATAVDRDQLMHLLAAQRSAQIVSFIYALADVLSEAEEREAEQAWNSWIRLAVQRRSECPPGMQTLAEKSAWGDMALRMGSSMAEALRLCDRVPGPLGPETTFDRVPEQVLREDTNLLAEVVLRRIQVTPEADWHVSHQLNSLVPQLVANSVDTALLRAMAEASLTIGIHQAGSWVDTKHGGERK